MYVQPQEINILLFIESIESQVAEWEMIKDQLLGLAMCALIEFNQLIAFIYNIIWLILKVGLGKWQVLDPTNLPDLILKIMVKVKFIEEQPISLCSTTSMQSYMHNAHAFHIVYI